MSTSSTVAVAVGDEAEGLLQQGALHPVHDEAVELPLHHDRRLADAAHDARRRAPSISGAVQGAGTSSTGRDEVGRVDRVARPGSGAGPCRCSVKREGTMRRGRAGEDRRRRRRQRSSSRHRAARFTSSCSGAFSCTHGDTVQRVARGRSTGACGRSTVGRRLRRPAGPAPRGRRAGRRRSRARARRRLGSGSHSRTSCPARAKAMAQARPMRPAADDRDRVAMVISPHKRLDVAVDAERLARRCCGPAARPGTATMRGDVVRADHPAQRDALQIAPLHLLVGDAELPGAAAITPLDARALDDAGQDGVDADAVRARAPWRGSGSGR